VKYILINAASVTRHNPGKFWHPSRSILARLRRSTEVQLRIVAYDEKEGADLWDNEAIWVRLTGVGPKECSPQDVLAMATSNMVAAMRAHGIRRLVVLASPSVTEQGDRPGLFYRFVRLAMPLAMRAVTLDHRAQSRLVMESGLDWTIVRGALGFTDGPHTGRYQAGPMTPDAGRSISRADLAEFMLASATKGTFVHALPLVSHKDE